MLDKFSQYRRQFLADRDAEDGARTRVQYTREHKLAAIGYAKHTWFRTADGNLRRITKYRVCTNLKITPIMLKKWIKNETKILGQKRGSQRSRDSRRIGKEPLMEEQLYQQFEEARQEGRQVTHRWITR